jgi:AcrR family transcriptional regulator
MIENKTSIWIEAGYQTFADEGPNGLRIEVIAKKVGKSKSSFYHHFADLEGFTEALLKEHLERAKKIAVAAQSCKNMVPEMFNLLLSVKQDILFNRQLRVFRHIPAFKDCFERSHRPIEDAFLGIWAKSLDLEGKMYLARIILNLTIENFYLCITADTFTNEWLLNYLHEIRTMVREMMKNNTN